MNRILILRAKALVASVWCTFIILLAHSAGAEEPTAGKQVPAKTVVKVGSGDDAQVVTMNYLLFLPADYKADAKQGFPLLLFQHGSGERGSDLELVKKHGPPKLVEEKPDFPFVTVSPQCPLEQRWDAAQLSTLVDYLEANYNLDKDRLYVTGLSMGGSGTWDLIAQEPKRFAAAIPICGGGGGDDFTRAKLFADLPLWAFYGDQDRPAGLKQCQDFIAAVAATGNEEAKMTIYPNVGHDSWTETYANPEVYKWLLSHSKDAKK